MEVMVWKEHYCARRLAALFPDSSVRKDRKMSHTFLRKRRKKGNRLANGRNGSRLWVKGSLSWNDVYRGRMEEM